MRVLITGASGLIGRALTKALRDEGHAVLRLVRRKAGLDRDEAAWLPGQGVVDAAALEGLDAAVHLAGENIAAGRWTPARKARIRDSRVEGTRLLAETLAGLAAPPKVLVSASAVGYYGGRGDTPLVESASPGEGFLAEVCLDWEAAAAGAESGGIRVVQLRTGMVLSRDGGALPQMLTLFKAGLAGRLGSGRQYMSWIALDDHVAAIRHCLNHAGLTGPVNAVAPNPVTNMEFTKTLARVLRRPAVLPVPRFALRLALGEMADALLMQSARVLPKRLENNDFHFAYPVLEPALRQALNRRESK